MQETTKKLKKKNRTGKTQMETCRVGPRVKKGAKTQRSRFLQAYEIKISYTLEDGHVGRNMGQKPSEANSFRHTK
jgi:hypothetical protein